MKSYQYMTKQNEGERPAFVSADQEVDEASVKSALEGGWKVCTYDDLIKGVESNLEEDAKLIKDPEKRNAFIEERKAALKALVAAPREPVLDLSRTR